jgi:hypothetical protein
VTARILRIELRRSAAVWAALVSLPLVFSIVDVGRGMNVVAANQRNELLPLLIPLLLGVGAWQARRDRRSQMDELIATTALPGWRRRLPTAGALGVAAAIGSLVIFAGLAVYGAAVGAYLPVAALVAGGVAALYLAAAVWLGLAVGRMLPFLIVPPLLLVAGLVATAFLAVGSELEGYGDSSPPGTVLLNPAQREGFLYAQALTARAHLAQASWVIALAAACLLLFVVSRRLRPAAVLPVALGAAVAVALLPSQLSDAIELDRGALALVCTSDNPQVCARRAHPLVLDGLREPGQEALAILSAKLPQAPTSVVESYTVHGTGFLNVDFPQPDEDILYAEFPDGRVAGSDQEVLATLLMGAGTLACANFPQPTIELGDGQVAARLVAAAWLLEEEPRAAAPDDWRWVADLPVTAAAYKALLALPADQQRTRVAELREAELACDGRDRVEILTGPDAPR